MTASDSFLRAARAFPDRIAWQAGEESVTYAALAQNARRYAGLLRRQGTSPVLLYGPKNTDTLTAIAACLLARRAYVPVGLFTPPERLRRVASLTGATLAITGLSPEIPGAEVLPLAGLERYAGLPEQPGRNETAYVIFTSGSTGEPKGVPITYRNLDNFVAWISALPPLKDYRAVRVLNQADFSFDLSVADLYYALCNGHTLVRGAPSEDLPAVFQALRQVEVAVVTPTFLRLCLLNREFAAKEFSRLRCVYCCGETLEPSLAARFFAAFPGAVLLNAYGPTEATSAVSAVRITPEMANNGDLLPVGEAGGCAVTIEAPDGEIVLKGDSVFGGYLNGPAGGWFSENGVNCYRTGDLGSWENGLLYCRGRADGQIKYKGYRIELNEIECQLGAIEGVASCAVVARRNPAGTVTGIRAFYTGAAEEPRLKDALRKKLPDYMIPARIQRLDRLPVNANGKIDRKRLAERGR